MESDAIASEILDMSLPTNQKSWSRRAFLGRGLVLGVGAPLALRFTPAQLLGAETTGQSNGLRPPSFRSDSRVAIVRCRSYAGGPSRTAKLLMGTTGWSRQNRKGVRTF